MKEFIEFDSKNISWFRCGGKISVYCIVDNLLELKQTLEKYSRYKDKTLVIGAGSNILIRDRGFNGLVIKLSGDFNKIIVDEKETNKNNIFLNSGAGALDKQLSDFAIKNNIIGCEFLDTIPGTIGGAIKMNAGCFDCEIKDILHSVNILLNNETKTLTNKDLCFSYRKSVLPENAIILSATFSLKKGNNEQIKKSENIIKNMRLKRKENQIIGATCGSTFKNPMTSENKRISAWKLIESVGLRGFRIGGAKFSEKHCNFLINDNKATATDIENLILLAKQKIKEKFNIQLEEEVKIF